MTAVIPLLFALIVSRVIVHAGATAFELTGLDKNKAKFQALSAFTGAGFTTRESEQAIATPVRRRITSFLMTGGYAGTASVVATAILSMDMNSTSGTLKNVAVLVAVGAIATILVRKYGHGSWLVDFIRRELTKRMTADEVPHEDLISYQTGFGVTRIEVPTGSRVSGSRLRDLDFRQFQLQVLAIEEGHELLPVPHPDTVIVPHQHLILYGRLASVQEMFRPMSEGKTVV
jgi:hypothetical protein